MEPSNYGKEILRKNRIFKFKNANFSNTCIILWLKFSATLPLGGGWGGEGLPPFMVIYFFGNAFLKSLYHKTGLT